MAENPKEWPRCHTCLRDWCPEQSDDCMRCDRVLEILMRKAADYAAENQPLHVRKE